MVTLVKGKRREPVPTARIMPYIWVSSTLQFTNFLFLNIITVAITMKKNKTLITAITGLSTNGAFNLLRTSFRLSLE